MDMSTRAIETNRGNVLELFHAAVDSQGAGTAVEWKDKRLSYLELDRQSNNIANYLISRGAGPGTIVAVLVEDVTTLVTAIIGIMKAGAAFAPLDANYPVRRLEAVLEEASPKWLIVDRGLIPRLESLPAQLFSGAMVVAIEGESLAETFTSKAFEVETLNGRCVFERPKVALKPNDITYLYFTSGSTGRPKAIAGCVKGLSHFIRWEINTFKINREFRVSQLHAPSFDPFLRDVFAPLCSGGTVCAPDKNRVNLNPRELIQWLDRERITLLHIVPTLFRAIVDEAPDPDYFQSLKYVLLAGEQVFPAEVRKWNKIYRHRIQLVNLYGPTETTLAKFCHFLQPSDEERKLIPIGNPIEGARAVILDDDKKICAPGTVGEIYIRTPYRSLGYYNRPELTKEVFIQNPFNPDPTDLLYKTGDMGRILDGSFELLGRRDNQVKIRGVRIELEEVEKLLREDVRIKEVVVRDWEWPDRGRVLCGYYTAEAEVKEAELRERLRLHLPEAAVPAIFVRLAELPRNLNGKIDRRNLPDPIAHTHVEYVGPRNATERELSEIWRKVLQVERVGVSHNFFSLGGHSLKVTRLISSINRAFQIWLPVATLFQEPTIAGLAPIVDGLVTKRRSVPAAPEIPRAPRTDRLPLSFAQERLWFLDQLDPGSATYIESVAIWLKGRLNLGALENSLSEIVGRHEALRTNFVISGGQPVQICSMPKPAPLPVCDLMYLTEEAREELATKIVNKEAQRPFDLAEGRLFRAVLLRLEKQNHVLMLAMHHIVCDGWSRGILVVEMAELYRAFSEGRPASLPELPIQYADFAYWQRHWLQGEVLKSQLKYWREKLGGELPVLDLPTDRQRPPVQSYKGATETMALSKELSEKIGDLSRHEGVTLFMTLLAAFKSFLYRYTGLSDLLLGTPTANRNRQEVEGLIGFFVNTLVIRTDLSGNPTFRELLSRVRKSVLEAHANQDVPFEKVVEEIQPERHPNRSPIFQVMFALQNAPDEKLRLPELTVSAFKIERLTAKFDLVQYLVETAEGLLVSVEYNTDLFDATTIALMLKRFERLLESAVDGLETRLDDLDIFLESEKILLESTIDLEDVDVNLTFRLDA